MGELQDEARRRAAEFIDGTAHLSGAPITRRAREVVRNLLAALDDRDAALVAAEAEQRRLDAHVQVLSPLVGQMRLRLFDTLELLADITMPPGERCNTAFVWLNDLSNHATEKVAALGSVSAVPTDDEPEKDRATADRIASAVLLMLNTLHLLNGLDGVPFAENVAEAVERFDQPDLRSAMAARLYGRPFADFVSPAVPTEPAAPPAEQVEKDIEALTAAVADPKCVHCDKPIAWFPNHAETDIVWVHTETKLASCRVAAEPDALWFAAVETLAEHTASDDAPAVPLSVEEASEASPEPEPIGATEPPTEGYVCAECGQSSGMQGHYMKDHEGWFFGCQEPERRARLFDKRWGAAPSVAPAPPSGEGA